MSEQARRTKVEAWAVGAPQRALAVLALELRQQRQPWRSQRGYLRRHTCHCESSLRRADGGARNKNQMNNKKHDISAVGREDRFASDRKRACGVGKPGTKDAKHGEQQ